jgi:hypothetical protein
MANDENKKKGPLSSFFVRDRKVEEKKDSEKTDEKAKEVTVEDIDIIDTLLSGKEIETTFENKYGAFKFKYPSGQDRIRIARRRAEYLGGLPNASFDPARLFQFEMWSTLDILIVGTPDRFKKMESWADCPDQSVVEDLYTRGSSFCVEIRDKIGESGSGHALE